MFRFWAVGALLFSGSFPGHATTCARLNPCARIRPGSVVFIGTVSHVDNLPQPKPDVFDERTARVRLTVREIFAGLPEGVKEVTVETGRWMTLGKDYLLDAG